MPATWYDFFVPSNETVVGVTVYIERSVQGGAVDNSVRLIVGGSIVGDDKADDDPWPSSDAVAEYGGATDLWGLTTLTPADVNAQDFGVALSASMAAETTASVDAITVTVCTGGVFRTADGQLEPASPRMYVRKFRPGGSRWPGVVQNAQSPPKGIRKPDIGALIARPPLFVRAPSRAGWMSPVQPEDAVACVPPGLIRIGYSKPFIGSITPLSILLH